jgi:malonyl-CoA decarboxylase
VQECFRYFLYPLQRKFINFGVQELSAGVSGITEVNEDAMTQGSEALPPTGSEKRVAAGLTQSAHGWFERRLFERHWFERLRTAIADGGSRFAPIPAATVEPVARAAMLAESLHAARGEASGAAVARELMNVVTALTPDERAKFIVFLSEGFQPDPTTLADAASRYLEERSPKAAAALAEAADPPRQELLRRMNMAEGGTAALVQLRSSLPSLIREHPEVSSLDSDLRHLFASWFNRGFLELRQIDWHTPAAILEKLIAYEAVHEIQGWDDLRRRLAPDRRCFAFFHPALRDEPLIFVEVALVSGLADDVQTLLDPEADVAKQRRRAAEADTAIFYSISNCQAGLRGISFGNFLIKQVVEELRAELPHLSRFSTLSPIPAFRRWLDARMGSGLPTALSEAERKALLQVTDLTDGRDADVLRTVLESVDWCLAPEMVTAIRPMLLRLCAHFLCQSPKGLARTDPVARFHLGNGARLERINWGANLSDRGLKESWGLMVNYLYDPAMIEANHEQFARTGKIARSAEIDQLLGVSSAAMALSFGGRRVQSTR